MNTNVINTKGRQVKLLAAVAVLAMVVCAFAVVVPSEDVMGAYAPTSSSDDTVLDKDVQVGTADELLALADKDPVYGNRIIVTKDSTITLTSNISGDVNVAFILDGGKLTITSAQGGKYSLSIASNAITNTSGDINYNAVVYANKAATFTVDNADVSIDNITQNAHILAIFNNQYAGVNLNVDVKNGATLTLKQTGTVGTAKGDTGTAWLTGTNAVGNLNVDKAYVEFDNIGSLQANVVTATNGAVISGTMDNSTFTAYFKLTNSEVNVNTIGIYSATLTGASINATTVGIYSGSKSSTVSDMTISQIKLDKDSSVTATEKFFNSLGGKTGLGDVTIVFDGAGNVTGDLTGIDENNDAKYKFVGTNASVTVGANATIDADSTYAKGAAGTTAEVAPSGGSSDVTSAVVEAIKTNASVVEVTSGTITGNITVNDKQTLVVSDSVSFETVSGTEKAAVVILAATESTGSITSSAAVEVNATSGANFTVQSKIGDVAAEDLFTFDDFVGNMTVAVGSVDITDADIQAGGLTAQVADVKLAGTITGEFVLTLTQPNSTISVEAGKTFTVEEGATFTIQTSGSGAIASSNGFTVAGTLGLAGSVVSDIEGLTISSSITADQTNKGILTYPTTTLSGVALSGTVSYVTEETAFEFKGQLSQDQTVSTNQSLTGDLYIPNGLTLTIASGATLNLAGYGIYVQGTLEIQTGGAINNIGGDSTKSVFDNSILLHRDGAIINDGGVIGSGTEVKVTAKINQKPTDSTQSGTGYEKYAGFNTDLRVTYASQGSVTLQNVSGVSFEIANVDGTRTLAISGEVYTYGMSGIYNISASENAVIDGTLTIGEDVTLSGDVKLQTGATLNVEGTVSGKVTMVNNTTVNVEGTVSGSIVAETGKYQSSKVDEFTFVNATVKFNTGNNYVAGVVLTVGQNSYTENGIAYTEQILYISGNTEIIYANADDDSKVTMDVSINKGGIAKIAADDVLDIDENVNFTASGAEKIDVLGQVTYVYKSGSKIAEAFNGTAYVIKGATASDDDIGYITTFANAYQQIANAKDGLTVYGDLEIEIDVTLASGQKITINGSSQITIGTDYELVAQKGSTVTGTIYDAQGILTVYSGANVKAPSNYAVYKQTTEYRQWSGLVPAIENAQSGDVIDVQKDATVKNDMSVPAGVTVNVEAGVVLTFQKDLTVEETAVLNNEGTIQMAGEKSAVTVNGTLDSSESGSVVQFVKYDKATKTYKPVTQNGDGESRSVTSVGTTVMKSTAGVAPFVSAASYSNEDGNTVYTTVAKAVAAVEAQDSGSKTVTVVGTLNEAADVTLAAGTTLNIASKAKVTLGTITLSAPADGKQAKVEVDGELTATVAGMTGVAGSETAASVELVRAAAEIYTVSATDDANVTSNYMVLDGKVVGAVTVSAGTVNAGDLEVTNAGDSRNSLTVASGATLAVADIGTIEAELTVGTLKDAAAVTVDGTVAFGEGSELTLTGGIMDVNGTMTVSEADIEVAGTLNVAGTLDVSTVEDEEGSVAVTGILVVGEKPTTLGAGGVVSGAFDTANGIIKAYAGADLTGALLDVVAGESAAESTAYYVNGDLYMTVYSAGAFQNNIVLTGAYAEDFELVGLVTYVEDSNGKTTLDINDIGYWYSDAEMSKKAAASELGTPEALYFKAPAAEVTITVSVGDGISLYIDDVRQTGNTATLTVGTHTVTATVNPGYSGTVTVQFNGQTVDGTFTITPEMASNAYDGPKAISATGSITQDSVVIGGGSSDDGMGLTDYLLIILVILIVIMAIMVAMRLMRS